LKLLIKLNIYLNGRETKIIVDSISSIEQVDTPIQKKKSKAFPIIVGILLLLILGMGGYYVYKEYFAEKEVVDESPIPTEEEEDASNIDVSEYTDIILTHDGWGLFSLPQYGLSVEVPSYTMVRPESYYDEETKLYRDVKWSWTAKISDYKNSFYPNYLTTALLSFYPESADDLFNCGGGCADEHYINVFIFSNEESKSLSEVKDVYFANVMSNGEENNFVPTITQKEETMWGHKVISFTETTPSDMDEIIGHIVVNSKFVYLVQYYLSDSPEESHAIGQKVIDSFEFEE